MKRVGTYLALAILATPSPCLAWGAEGHRIAAEIAADQLTPAARAQVATLLGSNDPKAAMVAASAWADEIRRQRPNTAPWHFVDIPLSAPGYNAARDCPRDDCVVGQIERDARIVGDRQLAAPVRAEALRFLIHFVGDVHQPLHDADNGDRGGNRVQVVLGRRYTNLHAVWDIDVVRALGRDPEEVATRLEGAITPAQKSEWSEGSAVRWANEEHQIARDEVYSRFGGNGDQALKEIFLTPGYARQESAVAAQQLEKAGVRLAAVLNATLR